LAWIIDFVAVLVVMFAVSTVIRFVALVSEDFSGFLGIVAYFVLSTGYAITLEWVWRGQTIGKRLFGLRVMDAAGLRLTFSQVAIRNLLRAADMLPSLYLVGGITALVTQHHQRLGDIAANTVVIRARQAALPRVEAIAAGKYNSLRDHPRLQAQLRQAVSPDEATVALDALMRRENFDPSERVRIFHELAKHFRERVPFPDDVNRGVTDEQYLRNVVDSLYRRDASPSARMAELSE
jgi:uncharacterized RDD family membrane protein YckC